MFSTLIFVNYILRLYCTYCHNNLMLTRETLYHLYVHFIVLFISYVILDRRDSFDYSC